MPELLQHTYCLLELLLWPSGHLLELLRLHHRLLQPLRLFCRWLQVLLPLSQIQTVSKAAGPVTAADVVCHEAPYYAGNVHYCYYEQMRSDAAYGAGTYSPSHVDILSFDNAKLPATYLKEMKAGGGPTASTLAATPTMVVKFDPKASIGTAPDASGQPVIVTGPTVSVYQSKGNNVVYTVCANPRGGGSAALTTCAKALAKAQLAKL